MFNNIYTRNTILSFHLTTPVSSNEMMNDAQCLSDRLLRRGSRVRFPYLLKKYLYGLQVVGVASQTRTNYLCINVHPRYRTN